MGKTYVRVDDRLIHGQTIVAWCPTLGIQEIIGIDNVSAANPMLKSIMTMGVPKNYKTSIVTSEEAMEIMKTPSDANRLVIVKFPTVLSEIKSVLTNDMEINLGNIAKREDTIHNIQDKTGIFYLSDEDVSILKEFANDGFNVYFQQLPSTGKVEWDTFIKTI